MYRPCRDLCETFCVPIDIPIDLFGFWLKFWLICRITIWIQIGGRRKLCWLFRDNKVAIRNFRKNTWRIFFIFAFFKKKFTEIYFWFQVLQFCTPTAWQGGGRGPTARQVSGRDLYVNKNKFILRRDPWREPAAPCRRPPAARQGGGRIPPQI